MTPDPTLDCGPTDDDGPPPERPQLDFDAWEVDDTFEYASLSELNRAPLPQPFDLEDDSTLERWAQNILLLLVDWELAVDGILGTRTRRAIRQFQRYLPLWYPEMEALPITGTLDDATVRALAEASGTEPPGGQEPAIVVEPVEGIPELVATEEETGGKVWQVVRAGDREVRFRYRVRDRRKLDGSVTKDDPYNVWSYEGASSVRPTAETLRSIGFSPSGARIFLANAHQESGGKYGTLNTWDNQVVSWGIAQFAGHAGTLARLLTDIKDGPRTREAFVRWFSAQGIDVAHGEYPYYHRSKKRWTTRTGYHVVVTVDGKSHAGDHGWELLRTQPSLLGAMLHAGNDPDIQLAQAEFWLDSYLEPALNRRVATTMSVQVHRAPRGGGPSEVLVQGIEAPDAWKEWARENQNETGGVDLSKVVSGERSKRRTRRAGDFEYTIVAGTEGGGRFSEFATSEFSGALAARLTTWMPAYLRPWFDDFAFPRKVTRPEQWASDTTIEEDLQTYLLDRRRKAKKGSWDDYALQLDRSRGSYS